MLTSFFETLIAIQTVVFQIFINCFPVIVVAVVAYLVYLYLATRRDHRRRNPHY